MHSPVGHLVAIPHGEVLSRRQSWRGTPLHIFEIRKKCQAGDSCTLREATIVCACLREHSIPPLHAAAGLLKIAEMDYNGVNSLFLRVLIEKKYALVCKKFLAPYWWRLLTTKMLVTDLTVLFLAVSCIGRVGFSFLKIPNWEEKTSSFMASVFFGLCRNICSRYQCRTKGSFDRYLFSYHRHHMIWLAWNLQNRFHDF